MTASRLERIRAMLQAALAPEALELRDDSALHAGHAGARDGAGHYFVKIVAGAFAGLPRIKRHRLVYGALAPMMSKDIHALSIDARAPGEP